MKTELEFPSNLPPLPEPPAGHKWFYLGKGVVNEDEGVFLMKSLTMPLWIEVDCCGGLSTDYAEAVPIETEPDYNSPEYRKGILLAAFDGKECEAQCVSSPKWYPLYNLVEVAVAIKNRNVRIKPPEPATDQYAELKAAHAAGKVIEVLTAFASGDAWSRIDRPNWNVPPERYRVKPTPITVPLEAADFPTFFWIRFRPGSPMVLVHSLDNSGVSYAGKTKEYEFTYQQLMDGGWEYSADRKTWTPCSKTVEQ